MRVYSERTGWATAWLLAFGAPPVAAQVDPVARLAEALPADVAVQVIERVDAARSAGLPARALASLALEGVAKGRSATDVLAAVDLLAGDMDRARAALEAAGRAPGAGEVEAATAAMRMGVDGSAVSELARSGPSGRSLAVPLLVLGSLAERGLPSDEALAAVRDRLQARADDAALLRAFPDAGRALGRGMRPDWVGPAGGLAGFDLPASGREVPIGPPVDRGRRPDGRGRPSGVPAP
jgi:hypothetical protein